MSLAADPLQPCVVPLPDDPACWLGPEILKRREEWTVSLSQEHVVEVLAAVAQVEKRGLAMERVLRDDFPLPTLGPVLKCQVAAPIENGRGFALLRGLPVGQLSATSAHLMLWGLGTYLGTAEKQDAAGLLMHDVRDISPKADSSDLAERMAKDSTIRGFQTNAALPYHTDGCDAFALCCLKKGNSGGESLLISAPTIFNTILAKRPDLAKVLQEPFHFDARGQRSDGAKCQVCPIFTIYDGRVNVLHKEPYIHSAQRFEDVPRLSVAQKEALEFMREVMDSDDLAMRFTLEPGDCIVATNHSTLHGRTAFDSYAVATDAEAERSVRHMLRLWLTVEGGRRLPPHYASTREYCDTYSRRVARKATVLDGSMGRLLLNYGLPADGKLWSARALVDKEWHSEVVRAHVEYIKAGADYITTNNFAVQPGYYRQAFDASCWSQKLVEHTKLSAKLARQARDESGQLSVKILGCLPPLVSCHRPDLTEEAYLKEGRFFYEGVYKSIADALSEDVDVFIAETMSTTQEMLCAVRAAASVLKPVVVAMAAALRDSKLHETPSRAAEIAEFVLQEVEEGRADIPMLCFNCGTPDMCTAALAAIPNVTVQRLKNAGIELGVYPNLNEGVEARQKKWQQGEPVAKIARMEGMTDEQLCQLCDGWASLGAGCFGGCCGSTPADIKVIAAHLKTS
jgi:S-methylmethionine-dependent homocysteine/selenocysteine methylase